MPFCPDTSRGLPGLIYRHAHYVVVNKPAGMATHPGPGVKPGASLMAWLRRHLGQWVYPVHRLDAPVSGVLLMALSPSSAGLLQAEFAARSVDKHYVGVVRGWLSGPGRIDKPLARLGHDDAPTQEPQPAVTDYAVLGRWEQPFAVRPHPTSRYCALALQPHTGRTHQLRRHLAALSHPLIGDTRYGDGAHNRAYRSQLHCQQLLLHAERLVFTCPYSGIRQSFRALFAADWAAAVGPLATSLFT